MRLQIYSVWGQIICVEFQINFRDDRQYNSEGPLAPSCNHSQNWLKIFMSALISVLLLKFCLTLTNLTIVYIKEIQWNLSITDTLGLDIFGHFLLQYWGNEVENVLVTPFRTKIFVLMMEVFPIVHVLNSEGLLREIPLYSMILLVKAGTRGAGDHLLLWR